MAGSRSPHGFTVLELLVALAILAVVSSQLLLVFQGQQRAYIANERILDVQEDARLVMDLVTQETRMGGFMVPRFASVSSLDGGANGPDVLCVSNANRIDDSTLTNASQPFERARPFAPIVVDDDFVDLIPGDLDIDGNGTDDFETGDAIIVASILDSTCAIIVEVAGDRLNLDRAFVAPFGTDARIVPAVMYQVVGGLGLTRNALPLSAEVEDLQVEYGIDINGDSLITIADGEFPIDDLSGFNPARILQVRLTVTTRTPQADPDFVGGFDAAANRNAGAADSFRRRRFLATVRPRNVGN